MPVEKSAGVIIFRKEKDSKYYLLLHYPSGSRAKEDYWDLPKGHIEEGEQEIATAEREAEEETGIKDLNFVPGFREQMSYFFKFKGETIFKTVVFYLAETKTNSIELSIEHIGFKWLLYEEALKGLTFENAKEVLKKAHQSLDEA
ncbi:MAG: NUDIX domain-containing protein [bacterium]